MNYWTEPQGHVVAITDAEGNITSANYNALGQRTQGKDPDQGTWAFTYDAFGELLTQTDAPGSRARRACAHDATPDRPAGKRAGRHGLRCGFHASRPVISLQAGPAFHACRATCDRRRET